jgi:four helix bundle protein
MKKKIKDFTDLDVWNNCNEVKLEIYDVAKNLPTEEKYNLGSQMRRAAVSTTANIAEGYGRFHYQENIQFCRQSRGSLYELKDHVLTCCKLQYINSDKKEKLNRKIESATKLLNGYIKMLRNQKDSFENAQ